MDAYHIALMIHIYSMITAACTAGITHFAHRRYHHASTAGEALQWLGTVGRSSRVYPIATLTLFLTGGYMTTAIGFPWDTGWIVGGIIGVVILFIMGPVMGIRVAAAAKRLASMDRMAAPPPTSVVDDILSWNNTAVALAVVFMMMMKTSLTGSITALVVGAAAGWGVGLVMGRRGEVRRPEMV